MGGGDSLCLGWGARPGDPSPPQTRGLLGPWAWAGDPVHVIMIILGHSCVHASIYLYMFVYTYNCIYIYTYTYLYIHTYIHIHICIYIHIYIYIYINLHICVFSLFVFCYGFLCSWFSLVFSYIHMSKSNSKCRSRSVEVSKSFVSRK